MTTELSLSEAVARVTEETPVEEQLAVLDRIDAVAAQLRELRARYVAEYELRAVKERGRVTFGDRVFYVARDKDTQCLDNAATLDALFKACGGSFEDMARCISKNGILHGQSRKVLPGEAYGRLFETSEKAVLKSGEAAPLKLQAVDSRYVTGGVE